MTEPIKLQDVKQLRRYARIAIEREDALRARAEKAEAERDEARATLERCREVNDATAEGWRKTQIELDEARAELARMTTLRAMNDEERKSGVGVYWNQNLEGQWKQTHPNYATRWTPLPDVKEADK
jgi:hypothetical protein